MLLWITQKHAAKASDSSFKNLSLRHSQGTSRGTSNIRPDNFTHLPYWYSHC